MVRRVFGAVVLLFSAVFVGSPAWAADADVTVENAVFGPTTVSDIHGEDTFFELQHITVRTPQALVVSLPPELAAAVHAVASDSLVTPCDVQVPGKSWSCNPTAAVIIAYRPSVLGPLVAEVESRTFTVVATAPASGLQVAGTVTVRGRADLAIVSMKTRHDANGFDYLSVGIASHGPTKAAKTVLIVTHAGTAPPQAVPNNGCVASDGGYSCPVGDVEVMRDNEAFANIEVPLSQGWQSRTVTATLRGLYPDPVSGNNSASIGSTGSGRNGTATPSPSAAGLTPSSTATTATTEPPGSTPSPSPAIGSPQGGSGTPVGVWVALGGVAALAGGGLLGWRRLRARRTQ